MKNVERVLTSGLIAGYAGETQFSETTRGGFKLSSSHLENENETYHDEWLQARVGGGQELVEINGEKFTRLYAGGIVEEKILKKLEISEKEIIDFLKFVIINLKENTRLFEPCSYKNENNWSYNYQILDKDDNLSIITAKESISYKNTVVFLHNFLLCPIS